MNARNLFGTDGIRGKANIYPMTGEIAMALGRAVTHYFQKGTRRRPLIIIGKDTRLSCYMLEQAFASGVCSQGGCAIFTGPLPTPGVAFVTKSMRADAGVMISASHNPFYDNGIKIFDRNGDKLPDEVELELEKLVLDPTSMSAKVDAELGNAKRLDEVVGRYNVQVKSAFDSKYTLEGMKIVLDCANGAAYKIAPMIFSELGAEVIPLGVSPNGTNINEECGALHPENCALTVKKQKADLGICLDGDADRLVVIDERGEKIDGDHILGVCAKYLDEIGELGETHEVIGTVMSNLGLEIYLRNQGIVFHRTQVGDRYIIDRMKNAGGVFGGEPSGHIIFKNHSSTGDGILAALKVIECYKFYGRPFRDLVKRIKLFPQVLKNITVRDKVALSDNLRIKNAISDIEHKLNGRGRVLLRYSGTEPKIRIMVEGENATAVKDHCDSLAELIEKELN